MARQKGAIIISGRVGNKVYYYRRGKKRRKEYHVRRAPETVSQTTATKRAAADFGIASKSGKLIRAALHEHIRYCYDNTMHYRLTGTIFQTDNILSLKDFQFNEATSVQRLLNVTPVIENNDQGELSISFPGTFSKSNRALKSTTHLSIKVIGLSVDFKQQTTRKLIGESVIIKRGDNYLPITLKADANDRNTKFILLEVQSFYEVNGQLHVSQNEAACALDILAVIPAQEEPEKEARRYPHKAPRLWSIPTYPVPVRKARPIMSNSLPEG